MGDWAALIGNVGIGGGLAFFFAWYLVRAVIPQLMGENAQQREAFLAELAKQRAELVSALRELKESSESASGDISRRLSCISAELARLGACACGKGGDGR
jgi:hypothetical protein